MNYKNDLRIIDGFVGLKCERTLACSTLKIRFGEKNPYIWIDPPWVLEQNQEQVTASLDYPDNDDEFREWSKELNPLNETIFEKYEYSVKDGLSLYFAKGFRLRVPTSLDVVDEDDFYHHWYACEKST